MRRLVPACLALLLLPAGCSTSADAPAERIDAAWIARNGPSTKPRDGWVNTASGWYGSTGACLRYQQKITAGTGAPAGEGCLEPGI